MEPKKSTSQWIKNLKEWEYSLKSKYNRAKKNSRVVTEISNFEMRALSAFGMIRLKGNSEVSNLYFPDASLKSRQSKTFSSSSSGSSSSVAQEEPFSRDADCFLSEMENFSEVTDQAKEPALSKKKSFEVSTESWEQLSPPKKKSRSSQRDPDMADILNILSEQNTVNQKNAATAEKNAESLAIIANALKDVVGSFIENRQT